MLEKNITTLFKSGLARYKNITTKVENTFPRNLIIGRQERARSVIFTKVIFFVDCPVK